MTVLGSALRYLIAIAKHPASQAIAKHALRVATRELVNHIQKRTRGRKTTIHYS